MLSGLELTGPVGIVILALPIVILLVVIAIAKQRRPRRAEPRRDGEGPDATAPAPASTRAPASAPAPDLVGERIARAEAAGDERTLVETCLEKAREEVEAGREQEAAALLRKSIRLASQLGMKEAHARARLELGDIARAGGDLTTACEHWQIARALFFELKEAHALTASETRMRQHGCPTDWVLNDF